MGRLFWKFLFSYAAALLLALAAVGSAAWLYRMAEKELDPLVEVGPRATFIVASAAHTLHFGGKPGLDALMQEWASYTNDVLLFVIDDQGRDVLGRPVPVAAFERARELAREGHTEAARQVAAPDGLEYFLFVPFHPEPLWRRLVFASMFLSPAVPLTAGIVVSLGFGTLLAWYVSRPIRHLRGAFAALAVGRLETRVAPLIGERRDEVADLGRDFDRMAQHLQALISSQRSLLHDVSHELRSPLARLHAAIGLARQDPQKLDASLTRIENEAERLGELVGEILTLSRLEAGAAGGPLERAERVDLGDLAASIAADADFEAHASGRAVRFRGEGDMSTTGRVELLHRAIENVVRNAVQYTRAETTVEVTAARQGEEAVVTVADQGPGVAESELDAIFDPFYRGSQGQAGRGFGLGLAIARRAVEAHGGSLRARNRAEGGLSIEMRLPLR